VSLRRSKLPRAHELDAIPLTLAVRLIQMFGRRAPLPGLLHMLSMIEPLTTQLKRRGWQ
jgi:hypothetical protein